jgi:hypothetical protein
MERSDWEWADEALRDNRCSNEFAREAATRCEALRTQRDKLAKACANLVRWCSDPIVAETIDPDQASAFREAVRRAEECLAASGDMKRFQ